MNVTVCWLLAYPPEEEMFLAVEHQAVEQFSNSLWSAFAYTCLIVVEITVCFAHKQTLYTVN